MTNLTKLPLIALVTLGVAACGGEDTAAEQRADALEERGDMIEERTDEIEGNVDDMDLDDPMLADRDMDDRDMMDRDMDGMDTMGAPMMDGEAMVTVTVTGVQPNGGTVYVGLQDTGSFGSLDVKQGATADATADSVDVMIEGVPNGRYAVVAFQDTDGDGSTNLGPTGPAEPWGISGYEGGSPNPMNAMMNVEGNATATVELQGGGM